MPLYEYECEAGHRFEKIQKFSDAPVEQCPTCGKRVHKLMSSPAFQFKGSGWYITDYARKDKDTKDSKDTKETKDTKEGKDSKDSSEKKDSKDASTKETSTAKTSDTSSSSSSTTSTSPAKDSSKST